MICNSSEVEILFNKSLNINIKDGSLCRKIRLFITVENAIVNTPALRKELIIRLTDECDPFFLYSLVLNDDDFQSLKNQQGLLVDFPAFPQKFIDLLELCQKEELNEVPRFLLNLTLPSKSILDLNPAHLEVVETNPFKHLIHLSLKVLPASDNDIKKYLGTCLKTLKEAKEKLEIRLQTVEADLQQRLLHAQELLTIRNNEYEKIRTEFKVDLRSRENKHSEELSLEREKFKKIHREAENKWENERKELEQSHQLKIHQLEGRIVCLDSLNRELQEKQYKLDASNRELRNRVAALQEEIHQTHQKLQNITKENANLDAECQEQSRMISHLKSKLSLSEQEFKNLEDNTKRLQDQLTNENEQKKKLEENCDKKQLQINKQSVSIKSLSDDLMKGNEIIRKLQAEMHSIHAKLKIKDKITIKQEEVLTVKEEELKKLKEELENIKDNLKEKELENSKLTTNLDEIKQKLEDAQKQYKTSENIIKWLNKQLNEKQNVTQQSAMNTDIVSTSDTLRQNIYQPAVTSVRSHISVPSVNTNLLTSNLIKSTNIPSYSQGHYGTQRMINPNLKLHNTDNFATRLHTVGARHPLPSYYFQRQRDDILSTKAKEDIQTTQASKITEITIEEESPQPSPPPTCLPSQLKTTS
ncbi:spindle assembly abnormal protein 6 homolog [Centruroides sculpturatus]|uniref:spindle assembly abnormal protein 6 homolog n=1 Tax=Centruroides sculpturatus TaxID=218467 RepID=UPI000C6E9ED6|nr:spindle assembly abnormal protein 6 homolog [Centruroides sculpturatus]